jgi:hypothetical protein
MSTVTITLTGVDDAHDLSHALDAITGAAHAGAESGTGRLGTLAWTWTATVDTVPAAPVGPWCAECLAPMPFTLEDTCEACQEHPEHEECADGCNLSLSHGGACRETPAGPALCSHEVEDQADEVQADPVALDDAETARLVADVLEAREAHAAAASAGDVDARWLATDRVHGAEQRLTIHLARHGVEDAREYALALVEAARDSDG